LRLPDGVRESPRKVVHVIRVRDVLLQIDEIDDLAERMRVCLAPSNPTVDQPSASLMVCTATRAQSPNMIATIIADPT